jgi:hypothetical protein
MKVATNKLYNYNWSLSYQIKIFPSKMAILTHSVHNIDPRPRHESGRLPPRKSGDAARVREVDVAEGHVARLHARGLGVLAAD